MSLAGIISVSAMVGQNSDQRDGRNLRVQPVENLNALDTVTLSSRGGRQQVLSDVSTAVAAYQQNQVQSAGYIHAETTLAPALAVIGSDQELTAEPPPSGQSIDVQG